MRNGQTTSQITEEEPSCLPWVQNCPDLRKRCRSFVYLNGVFMVYRKSLNMEKSSLLYVLKRQHSMELKIEKREN